MQRDTTALASENKELKLRLESMDQQAQLRDGMLQSIIVNAFKIVSFGALKFGIVLLHFLFHTDSKLTF